MRSKLGRLWAYTLGLVALVGLLAWFYAPFEAEWPGSAVALGFALFQLAVWKYGFPVPSLGLTSMERVPQIAALLMFPPEVAVAINALPALAWPFVDRRYRQGSLAFGALRALHNACMIALMTAAAAAAYAGLEGSVPLRALEGRDALALAAAAVVMQVVNSGMMMLFLHLDGRDVRRLATWSYLCVDSLFVPIGLLAALVATLGDAATLSLFVMFLLLTVVSMHEIVESRRLVQERLRALDAASGARQAESSSDRVELLAERLLSQVGALLPSRIAYVALHDAASNEFDVVLQVVDGERVPRMRRPTATGVAGHVLRSGQPLLVDDWLRAPEDVRQVAVLDPGERPGSVLVVPIVHAGEVLGLISVQHDSAHRYSETDKHLLLAIAEDIAPVVADACTFRELDAYRARLEALVAERTAALEAAAEERGALLEELRRSSAQLERQSREDALTGLLNRRHFDECLRAELARARHHHPLCIAMVDIDHFKAINDGGGHALGDLVLQRIGTLLRGHFRGSDVVARIGGEEFGILLPETPLAGAGASLEQLRLRLEEGAGADWPAGLRVTLSAGVASLVDGDDEDALLRRADGLLYAAKRGGRNRVCVED